MVTLLVIADDFTGALDTGVQFSALGIATKVMVDDHLQVSEDEKATVLVVDVETRHISDEEAYQRVYNIVSEAVRIKIPYIYKKTDSALRGNISGELVAALDASNATVLPFIPAFPKMKRVTKGGIHYIDGVPVSQSVFGLDPFEPVTKDSVKEIIIEKHEVDVVEVPVNVMNGPLEQSGIMVFDASTEEDLFNIASMLEKKNICRLMAGCAGFAAFLPDLLHLKGAPKSEESLPEKLMVICGSVNPITKAQIAYGEKKGYPKFSLTPEEKTDSSWWKGAAADKFLSNVKMEFAKSPCCMIDSNDTEGIESMAVYSARRGLTIEDVRVAISRTMGVIACKVIEQNGNAVYLMTGGDTLMGLMKHIGCNELMPIREVAPGTVLTKLCWRETDYYIITKSGGFGDENLFESIVKRLSK